MTVKDDLHHLVDDSLDTTLRYVRGTQQAVETIASACGQPYGFAWPTPHSAGGIPMDAPNDNTAPKGLRGWWLSPPRSGMHRLINPWEYRHLRVFGVTRIAGGSVAAAAGVVCLSYGVYGWAAFFLVLAALNLAGGYWYLTIARSASART